MNQMGHTGAKKEVFPYINFFLHCFSAQSVIVAQVTAQQQTCACRSSPRSRVGKGGAWAQCWVSPSGGCGGGTAVSTGDTFFLSLKDAVVLHRAQMPVTASSCMKKCLQSLWLLRRLSGGMCNSSPPPTMGEVGFLTLRDACCTDSVERIRAPNWNFTARSSSSELLGLLVPFDRRYATEEVPPGGTECYLG